MKYCLIVFLFINLQGCQKENGRRAMQNNKKIGQGNFINYEWHKSRVFYEQEQMEDYVKQDSSYTYKISELGFFYAHKNKNDKGALPKKGDVVFFEWEVKNIQGAVIYDAKILGVKKYWVDKSQIMKGLRAGIKMMKKDEEVRFVFPSDMAYGVAGDGNKIGINQPIIVDVKLIKVNNLTK